MQALKKTKLCLGASEEEVVEMQRVLEIWQDQAVSVGSCVIAEGGETYTQAPSKGTEKRRTTYTQASFTHRTLYHRHRDT